ncbi:MAG: OadG family protein [Clostridia bacterium]|nr:OadG family protein [Clostridia bacterium]
MENLLAMSKIEAGPFVFIMGMLIIFFGMTIIVVVVSLIGKILKSVDEKKARKKAAESSDDFTATVAETNDTDDENLRAAIISAVMAAYLAETGSNCAFKIKKIKRL